MSSDFEDYKKRTMKAILDMKQMPADHEYWWNAGLQVIRDILIAEGFITKEEFKERQEKYFEKIQEERSITVEKKATGIRFKGKKKRKMKK